MVQRPPCAHNPEKQKSGYHLYRTITAINITTVDITIFVLVLRILLVPCVIVSAKAVFDFNAFTTGKPFGGQSYLELV